MQDTHECDVKDHGLTPPKPEEAIQWTHEVPTMPGWYWVRRAILRRNVRAWHEIHPGLVEVSEDQNGALGFYMPGLDHLWSFEDVVVAEWAGPVRPPAECLGG